jgi:gamma-glutamylcyclotransferase (GGCT)/AIG2-like uncharacterized protein YtfP
MRKLIFVYGTLKKDRSNHRVMGDSKLLGEAKVNGFKMYSHGEFPALVRGGMEISGEVYEVDDESTLRSIYSLEGYSGQRDSSRNWYDTTDVPTPFGEAELFYMKDESKYENALPVVESGVW